jgi:hypothetical protein
MEARTFTIRDATQGGWSRRHPKEFEKQGSVIGAKERSGGSGRNRNRYSNNPYTIHIIPPAVDEVSASSTVFLCLHQRRRI